jgi:hypothetical protein
MYTLFNYEEWRLLGYYANIPEDAILHSHRRENLKSYIVLTGWSLQWRRNVSPVKYELAFYIPEYNILHSHRRENLKSFKVQLFSEAKKMTGYCSKFLATDPEVSRSILGATRFPEK